MFYRISDIEGIGLSHALKLEKARITTTQHLLEKARDPQARARLVDTTGIRDVLISKWVAMADLMQVKGIGRQYSELLFAAGVDSTKKLLESKPDELFRKMVEHNKSQRLSGRVPKLADIEQWMNEMRPREPVPARRK